MDDTAGSGAARWGVVVLLSVLAAVGVGWAANSDAPPPTVTVALPTTTTSPPPTTTPVAADPWTTLVATAVGPRVEMWRDPPASLMPDGAARELRAANQAFYADYSPERPDAPPIPSLAEAVAGRSATATGWRFDNPTSFGNPAVFVVTERHGDWIRVLVPVRPNGTEAWVRAADVSLSFTRLHLSVSIGERRLRLYDGDRQLLDSPVVVGKRSTPTPAGRYYVTDVQAKYAGSAYGPWILPLSGFSQALDEFAGGAPTMALHGTNQPELMGQDASNGCIRMPDDVITRLRNSLPLGTPVDIRP